MKHKYTILNAKEKKKINEMLLSQFGATLPGDIVLLTNKEENIYLVNRDITRIDLERVRVNSIGLYIGQIKENEIRLSIEGAQLIGSHATKNVVEIVPAQVMMWLRGFDLYTKEKGDSYVLLRSGDDIVGCGRWKDDKILNFVPKARRIKLEEE